MFVLLIYTLNVVYFVPWWTLTFQKAFFFPLAPYTELSELVTPIQQMQALPPPPPLLMSLYQISKSISEKNQQAFVCVVNV